MSEDANGEGLANESLIDESLLAECGSVERFIGLIVAGGVSEGDAYERGTRAAYSLIETAPQQLAGNFIYVCQYHNLRRVAAMAMHMNDYRTALSAHSEINKILAGVS